MITDEDLVFYIQVYKDYPLAAASLTRLRKNYPSSRVLVVSDGDKDPRYNGFVSRFGVEYIEGERLYGLEKGGRMLHRMLEVFMRKPAKFLVKMDTDTRIDRRFAYLPEGNFAFGYEEASGCLQGGCVLLPLAVCKTLHDSKLLLSEELLDWRKSWAIIGPPRDRQVVEKRVAQLGLVSFERILRWACLRLGIQNARYTEIYSAWKIENPNKGLKYAVVHPDKHMSKPRLVRWLREKVRELINHAKVRLGGYIHTHGKPSF